MNEASNFCNGECWHYPALNSTNMAYVPGQTDLNVKNMDLLAKHYTENKEDQEMYIEYNIHSTYGFLESKATNKFLVEELNTRPFIISRSTFPGHGRYASHWLGDNFSEWAFLRYSITGIFNF